MENKEYIFATKMIDKLSVYEFLTECSNEDFEMLKLFMQEIELNRKESEDDEESDF